MSYNFSWPEIAMTGPPDLHTIMTLTCFPGRCERVVVAVFRDQEDLHAASICNSTTFPILAVWAVALRQISTNGQEVTFEELKAAIIQRQSRLPSVKADSWRVTAECHRPCYALLCLAVPWKTEGLSWFMFYHPVSHMVCMKFRFN